MNEIAEAFIGLERGVQAAPMMSRWANSPPGSFRLAASIPQRGRGCQRAVRGLNRVGPVGSMRRSTLEDGQCLRFAGGREARPTIASHSSYSNYWLLISQQAFSKTVSLSGGHSRSRTALSWV